MNAGPNMDTTPTPPRHGCMVVDESQLESANEVFSNTGVNVTAEGRPYLGAAIN